jgi:hypothetical protein
MPKLEIARANRPTIDELLRDLCGSDIVKVVHGTDANFSDHIKSLSDKMPNGKSLGDCTLAELDMIGDFFGGDFTVEDLDSNTCLSAAWLFEYAAMTSTGKG